MLLLPSPGVKSGSAYPISINLYLLFYYYHHEVRLYGLYEWGCWQIRKCVKLWSIQTRLCFLWLSFQRQCSTVASFAKVPVKTWPCTCYMYMYIYIYIYIYQALEVDLSQNKQMNQLIMRHLYAHTWTVSPDTYLFHSILSCKHKRWLPSMDSRSTPLPPRIQCCCSQTHMEAWTQVDRHEQVNLPMINIECGGAGGWPYHLL